MTVHQAMIAVARDIASTGIGKTRDNEQQHYKFRGVDEVMNAFAPILAKHGLIVVPQFDKWEMRERPSRNGGVLFDVLVAGRFAFTHEDGSILVAGPFYGEAMDSADKATNKAMAVAFKYAMFQTFCVPLEGVTGGDADAQSPEVVGPGAEWIDAVGSVQSRHDYDAMRAEMMQAFAGHPPQDVKRAFAAKFKTLPEAA